MDCSHLFPDCHLLTLDNNQKRLLVQIKKNKNSKEILKLGIFIIGIFCKTIFRQRNFLFYFAPRYVFRKSLSALGFKPSVPRYDISSLPQNILNQILNCFPDGSVFTAFVFDHEEPKLYPQVASIFHVFILNVLDSIIDYGFLTDCSYIKKSTVDRN